MKKVETYLTPEQQDRVKLDIGEWRKALDNASRNYKWQEPKIYVGYGTPLWCAWKKAERELYKKTTAYKLYKVRQAWRILFKLIIRTYFKRNK